MSHFTTSPSGVITFSSSLGLVVIQAILSLMMGWKPHFSNSFSRSADGSGWTASLPKVSPCNLQVIIFTVG